MIALPELAGVTHETIGGLHVARAGDPDAPPVVLLHGWPQHWWCWHKVIPALAREHHVIAPDLRGFGWSDAPSGRYEKATLAEDVLSLLDALEVETCVLAGHDWGGFVAWLMALRAPERIDRLVALSIIHPWFVPERNPMAVLRTLYQVPIITPVLNRVAQPNMPRIMRRIAAQGWTAQDAELYGAPYRDPAKVNAAANLYRTFLTRELTPIVRGRYAREKAAMPVTVATGSEDPVITPKRLEGVRAADLRVEILDGAGHFLPEERPDVVADLILHR